MAVILGSSALALQNLGRNTLPCTYLMIIWKAVIAEAIAVYVAEG